MFSWGVFVFLRGIVYFYAGDRDANFVGSFAKSNTKLCIKTTYKRP